MKSVKQIIKHNRLGVAHKVLYGSGKYTQVRGRMLLGQPLGMFGRMLMLVDHQIEEDLGGRRR